MNSSRSLVFIKRITCPPPYDVVRLLAGALTGEDEARTLGHLRSCDFCGAEADLLARHPPAVELVAVPLIPEPLRLLAESLLTGRLSTADNLETLNCEINALGRA